ncbi:MAG: folate family ECF transporter S component [Oscillospiraceae bacterium]|nr:folate family ECF transporter S component [Oscillospiraceae bacterium]
MKILKKLGVKKLSTKELVLMSLLTAMNIVFVRLLSFQTLTQRISFGFITNALAGMMLGPVWAGVMGVVSDVLGMMLFSKGMVYFPLFGISEFLYGFVYGLFLYGRKPTFLKVILCVVIQAAVISMFLTTLWTYLYCMLFTETVKGFGVIFISRIIPALVNIPIHTAIVYFAAKYIPASFLPDVHFEKRKV